MSGIWHPVVGTGAAYEMTDRDGKKTQMEITIVGKEDVSGKPGYWMEMAMASPRSGGDMYMKYLIAPGDKGMTSVRMIMQMPGQDPMEMDMSMMNMGGRQAPQPRPRHSGKGRTRGNRNDNGSRWNLQLPTLPDERWFLRCLGIGQGRPMGPGENAEEGYLDGSDQSHH